MPPVGRAAPRAKRLGNMDERIQGWAAELLDADVRAFRRARRRFLVHPTEDCLHDVRTSARRLRSLCEDFGELAPCSHRGRLHRLISIMGEARDAAVLRETLLRALDVRERAAAKPLLRDLRKQERHASRRVYHALARLRL
jgi:CHAD domain-containing protein